MKLDVKVWIESTAFHTMVIDIIVLLVCVNQLNFYLDQCTKLKMAVEEVLHSFRVSSPHSNKAVEMANSVLLWCRIPENSDIFQAFTTKLFTMLESTMKFKKRIKYSTMMERVWGCYHQQRCSQEFKTLWCDFLQKVSDTCTAPSPIFYQYVTDSIFKDMIKDTFPIRECDTEDKRQSISYEEANSVRYIAGYILRALKTKIAKSSLNNKEELLLCLIDLLESSEEAYDDSSDWVNSIDRGGLNHVSNNMSTLLSCMELVVKHHLATNATPHDFNMKDQLTAKITTNHNVEFYWDLISENWREEDSKVLLNHIIDLWITIRGFAHTSSWMERYKSAMHKNVQKSKGIRKKLVN